MTSKDELGDRMKAYEATQTDQRFDPTLPVYARIDGRGFSKFTKNMQRPFDVRMNRCMIETTKYLVEHTHAAIGYVQSDEISLTWAEGKHFFAGRIQKSCSTLAGMTAAKFAVEYANQFGYMSNKFPHFDCRVLSMPSRVETANMFLWRTLDARKNAISMAARHFFPHSLLQNKSSQDMIKLLSTVGAYMDDYPIEFTQGIFVKRQAEQVILGQEELAKIPEDRRPDSNLPVIRTKIKELHTVPFIEIKNRTEFIFEQVDFVTVG